MILHKKPKLVFHIGLHKTGTTFIQYYFAANLEVFANAGFLPAPQFDLQRGRHHQLAWTLANNGLDAFSEALSSMRQPSIVTSENFTHWIARNNDSDLERLACILTQAYEPKIVIFLRRQDFLKESVFAEVATSWYKGSIEQDNHYHYDFNRMLLRLEKAFGHSRVGVGVYRDNGPNDLVEEFLRAAAIDIDRSKLRSIPAQRVSLGRRIVALMAKLDKSDPKLVRLVKEKLRTSGIVKEDKVKYQMSPDARREFLRLYRDGNRELAKRFGFSEELSEYLVSDDLHTAPWHPLEPFTGPELALLAMHRKKSIKS
jgi:hypothetical protein